MAKRKTSRTSRKKPSTTPKSITKKTSPTTSKATSSTSEKKVEPVKLSNSGVSKKVKEAKVIVAEVSKVPAKSNATIPAMATHKDPDIKGFIPKAKVGGFGKGEFKRLAEAHFEGHKVDIQWLNARQCFVLVNGSKIDRVFVGRKS